MLLVTILDIGARLIKEETEVIHGAENVINLALKNCSWAKSQVDICGGDSNGPSIFVIPNHPVTMAFRELKQKAIKIRFIAEITKNKIPYLGELMKIL